jgi:hypothetical protein
MLGALLLLLLCSVGASARLSGGPTSRSVLYRQRNRAGEE